MSAQRVDSWRRLDKEIDQTERAAAAAAAVAGNDDLESSAASAEIRELSEAFERVSRRAFELRREAKQETVRAYAMLERLKKLKERQSSACENGGGESAESDSKEGVVVAADGAAAPAKPPPSILDNAVVVLCRTSGPTNLGQICRTCVNLGLGPDQLRLVAPTIHPNTSEARRFAMRSKPLLLGAKTFSTLREAVADCGLVVGTCGKRVSSKKVIRVVTPDRVPALVREHAAAERFAIVFGPEADGMSSADLQLCNACVTIPSRAYSSYNLSCAVAITLYSVFRAAGEGDMSEEQELRAKGRKAAVFKDLEALQGVWERAISALKAKPMNVREYLRNRPMSSHMCHKMRLMFQKMLSAMPGAAQEAKIAVDASKAEAGIESNMFGQSGL